MVQDSTFWDKGVLCRTTMATGWEVKFDDTLLALAFVSAILAD